MDLQEFLLFCKNFEIPLSSKAKFNVFKRVLDKEGSGNFTRLEFKESLK